MTVKCKKNIKSVLEKTNNNNLVEDILVKNNLIESVSIINESVGKLVLNRLTVDDAEDLFNFYFKGLSEKSRKFFCPYPLFNPFPISGQELAKKIIDWQKEDDWVFFKLFKNEEIIGVCHLKRYKTPRPNSGLAVRQDYKKKGLGFLMQTIINEQARLLGLRKLYVTLAQDNIASLKVHTKCGFNKTANLVSHFIYKNGVKKVDRQDIEMVLELI